MVAPILGPFSVTTDQKTFYKLKRSYKQTKPYNLPAPYHLEIGRRIVATGNMDGHWASEGCSTIYSTVAGSAMANAARINAYEKLKAKISDRASMGENLLEWRKSLGMIVSRAMQLYQFTSAVKRGHFGLAAHILRTPEPRHRHPVKESANNWLEFHLGIAPVVGDIYSALNVLQNPIPDIPVRARASGGGDMLGIYNSTAPYAVGHRDWEVKDVSVHYQCEVAVSNPNLWLANSLGIVNPLQVAWQMIPLSFVLDWFVNVEQFLGTGSDFLGLTTKNAFTTLRYHGTYHEVWNTYGWKFYVAFEGMDRSLGLTLPSLGLRPYKATSWQRGLTAISLLVGSLKSLDTTGLRNGHRDTKHFFKFDKNLQKRIADGYDWTREANRRS